LESTEEIAPYASKYLRYFGYNPQPNEPLQEYKSSMPPIWFSSIKSFYFQFDTRILFQMLLQYTCFSKKEKRNEYLCSKLVHHYTLTLDAAIVSDTAHH